MAAECFNSCLQSRVVTATVESCLVFLVRPLFCTLAIGKAGAINAALLAAAILSVRYESIEQKLKKYRKQFEKKVPKKPF